MPALKEMIGQMFILGFDGKVLDENAPIVQDILQKRVGGVILFDYHFQKQCFDKNIESPDQLKKLLNQLKQYQHSQSDIPLLISIDYEGGQVNRLKPTNGFPATFSAKRVAKMPSSEVNKHAEMMAKTLEEHGFNLVFAPVLDVDTNPQNPVIGQLERSFSNDVKVVSKLAASYTKHFKLHKQLYAYKHFPGHGSSTQDSHLGFVDVSETWNKNELEPYRMLLQSGDPTEFVMSAHIVNSKIDPAGKPATLSYKTLTDLLRHELGFKGVIVTDDMQMKAISEHYGTQQAIIEAINAGADMLIFGNQLSEKAISGFELVNFVIDAIDHGKIAPSRIEDAYDHIMAAKQSLR